MWAEPEGASLHILAAKPHMDTLFQQGAKGHVLAQGPVHCPVFHHHLSALQDAFQTLKRKKMDWDLRKLLSVTCEKGEPQTHLRG